MFLDAMEFWDERSGTVVGDPVNGRFFITRSSDGGNTWQDELGRIAHGLIVEKPASHPAALTYGH